MANRAEHDFIGMIFGAGVTLLNEDEADKRVINPLTGALLGKYASRLPDILEPASHPNHRAFFHSWVFFGILGLGMYKTWKWEAEDTSQKILKWALLVGGVAFASHLLRDSLTKKSLPVV